MNFNFKNHKIEVDDSWKEFFDENMGELLRIENSIGNDFTPSVENIFKIFKLPFDEIRNVIIGQDPYPQKGTATGRSFEINNDSWNYVNKSLEAILVSWHFHLCGSFLSYCDVLKKIENGIVKILPPNRFFETLEKEKGCFFLNKSLTCNVNGKNDHEKIWSSFAQKLVVKLGSKSEINWLLWGNFAKKLKPLNITKDKIFESVHPAAFSYQIGQKSEFLLKQICYGIWLESSYTNEILNILYHYCPIKSKSHFFYFVNY